ncbi:metallophosphoesterase family protein [Chloroflexota bacterium]
MRIGLISDTHIPWSQKELPPQVLEAFRGVDLILHAGDIYAHYVLDELERIAPVLAALGDDDYPGPDPRVQEKHILELEEQRLWLIHEGPHTPISPSWLSFWWQNRISPQEDKYGKPDIIVSGHEHLTVVERCDGVLHINPGSPTLLNYQPGLGTVGILELNAGKADVQIIQLGQGETG